MAVSKDAQNNRIYTFDLYGDLKFSDGSAITAKDYAFSILLTASPELAKLGGQSAAVGAILWGWMRTESGKSSVLRGVRLLSDTQMSITISKAYEPYFYEMALSYSPYPSASLRRAARWSIPKRAWALSMPAARAPRFSPRRCFKRRFWTRPPAT